MRQRTRLAAICGILGVVLLVLTCVALRPAAMPMLTQQQIEQRALQYAQDEYRATVTKVAVRRASQGQIAPSFCSLPQRVVVRALVVARLNTWDACDPNFPMWEAQLEGTFHWPGGQAHDMQMRILPDGTVQSSFSGPLEER